MHKFLFLLTALVLTTFLITSCDPEPEDPEQQELITKVIYTLIPMNGGDNVVLSFEDNDGDGGDAPIIEGGTLMSNNIYSGTIELYDESKSPRADIAAEVLEEALEHQFFFQTTVSGVSISYDDLDIEGNPIGLKSAVQTRGAGTGLLTVILRHEPDKSADGVSAGNVANAGGETDIEVSFPINVQ